jgi:DNA-binding transcriptional LysR family regulator
LWTGGGSRQLAGDRSDKHNSAPRRAGSAAGDGASGAPRSPVRSGIRSQDLLSLPVLLALLRERSVTRAGEVVGLSQPATSNALARLRRRFGDELLVRVGREYHLTPMAQSLLERTEAAFDAMERLFEGEFDPATSTREFTLVLSDYSVFVLSGPLVAIMRAEAPGVRLNLQQLSAASSDFDELIRHCDGIVLPPDFVRGHPNTKLLQDRWVCIAGSEADIGETVTPEDLARLPWVASFGSTLFATTSPVRQLRAMGIEPNVEITVESFQAVPFLVAGSHRIAFVQERLAARFADLAGVRVLESPLPRNKHLLSLYWDAIETNDPGHRWFRDALRRAAAAEADIPHRS